MFLADSGTDLAAGWDTKKAFSCRDSMALRLLIIITEGCAELVHCYPSAPLTHMAGDKLLETVGRFSISDTETGVNSLLAVHLRQCCLCDEG